MSNPRDSSQVNDIPIKIVFLVPGLQVGGAEMMLRKLLSCIDRKKFDPIVVSLTDVGVVGPDLIALDIPVICLNWLPGHLPILGSLRLLRALRELQPHIVQGWMYHGNVAALLATKFALRNVPVVWGVRGIHIDLKNEKLLTAIVIWLSARLSKWPVRIIHNSSRSAIQHEISLGYAIGKSVVIPNGFEADIFVPMPGAKEDFKAELGLPSHTKLIGLFARYHPMKNHIGFLQAAALLAKRRSDVAFVMAGAGVRNDNEFLVAKIEELELKNVVFLVGLRSDMERLTAAMDVMSLPSLYGEAFPNVIGEAMSCGVPCVVTDIGDSAHLVCDTGRVVAPGDVQALVIALEDLLSLSDSERAALGARARARVIENFEIEAVTRQYEQLYIELMNQGGSSSI